MKIYDADGEVIEPRAVLGDDELADYYAHPNRRKCKKYGPVYEPPQEVEDQ